jgi:hypothetical protein
MGAADYLAAADGGRVGFDGSVAETPWDRDLALAMRSRRRAVFEEDVTADILSSPVTPRS